VEHEVIVADRPSTTHILEILDQLGGDLIGMGTHGRSWLKHLMFGSVAEEVCAGRAARSWWSRPRRPE